MVLQKLIVRAFGLLFPFVLVSCVTAVEPEVKPGGEKLTGKTRMLRASANIIQRDTPTDRMGIYLVGFHPMKDNPDHQMEAHHFCHQKNEDFAQCAVFDGNTKDANLNGVEFIISEKLYLSLPEKEQKYWHPHNYEILSGQLVAPGIPGVAEKQLMAQKMNSYGKTWHVWNTGNKLTDKGEPMPVGEPMLAWSLNHDGEAISGLIENRDRELKVNTEEKKKQRQDLVEMAKPQEGVNALAKKIKRPTRSITGVQDASEARKAH